MGMATKPFLTFFFSSKEFEKNSTKHCFASRTFLNQNSPFHFQKNFTTTSNQISPSGGHTHSL
jgi:hypothetical protein